MLSEKTPIIKNNEQRIYGHVALNVLNRIAALDNSLAPASRRVLTLLTGYCRKDATCWPSIKRMASDMGKTRQAVIKQIRILQLQSYLSVEFRQNSENNRHETNLYVFNEDLANRFKTDPVLINNYKEEIYPYILWMLCVVTHVTLRGYMGASPKKLRGNVTSVSYPNKRLDKQIRRKKDNKTISGLKNANDWSNQKRFENESGITKEMSDRYSTLCEQLRAKLGGIEFSSFILALQKRSRNWDTRKEALQFMIYDIEAILNEISVIA